MALDYSRIFIKIIIQKATLCINSYFLLVIWSQENVSRVIKFICKISSIKNKKIGSMCTISLLTVLKLVRSIKVIYTLEACNVLLDSSDKQKQ